MPIYSAQRAVSLHTIKAYRRDRPGRACSVSVISVGSAYLQRGDGGGLLTLVADSHNAYEVGTGGDVGASTALQRTHAGGKVALW